MSTLNITEFSDLSYDARGNVVLVGNLSLVVASKNVSFTTATQSDVFSPKTRFIRVKADADACVRVGTNPTAVTTDTNLEANVSEYFGVQDAANRNHRLSVVAA